jgi:hypothetical protein
MDEGPTPDDSVSLFCGLIVAWIEYTHIATPVRDECVFYSFYFLVLLKESVKNDSVIEEGSNRFD